MRSGAWDMTSAYGAGSRVSGEQGIVLHTRPYRETSLIVSVFTLHHGRITAVAKGARGPRKSNDLQPFNNVILAWAGRGAMVTLTGCESRTHPWLKGDAMAAAFYVVELVTRLVGEHDSLPRVYTALAWAIDCLQAGQPDMHAVLRSFEKLLIQELGYGLDFTRDAATGEHVNAEHSYRLDLDHGFVRDFSQPAADRFAGRALLDIAADDFGALATRRAAKEIFRRSLTPLLGAKPLVSRRMLFRGQ